MISENEFERIAGEEFAEVPAFLRKRVKNVALLIEEDSPKDEGQGDLLGLYRGVPLSLRGEGYGVGETLPDTITLYRLPILAEAFASGLSVPEVIRETLWHEIGHYFGLEEGAIHTREEEGTNTYPKSAMLGGALRASRAANRFSSLTAYMAKTLALIFGILLVLIGLLGFIANPLVGSGGMFATDMVHNLIHIILGAVLLYAALLAPAQSGLCLKIVGAIALVLGLLGLFMVSAEGGMLLGIAWTNGASNWLHLILGVVILACGYWGKGSMGSSMGGGMNMPPIQRPSM